VTSVRAFTVDHLYDETRALARENEAFISRGDPEAW